MTPELSLVIPAFNEKARLAPFLTGLVTQLQAARINAEIFVVDDGSAEEDHQAYQALARALPNIPVTVLRHPVNQGKGAAIRTGFQHSRGAWMGFADADGSTSAEEVVRVARLALQSSDLDGVFAARVVMLGRSVDRLHQRHLPGRIFATMAGVLLRIPVYDSQCGCKFFRRATVTPLLVLCREERWLFDIEIIALGYFKRLRWLEVPISWRDVPGSKVRVVSDGLRMAAGLWTIRARLKALQLA